MVDPIAEQRKYYRDVAEQYDEGWSAVWMELMLPFAVLIGFVDMLRVETLLDVASGTGRAMRTIRHLRPALKMTGVEPSEDLRRVGHRAGIDERDLVDGDATDLQYDDNSFDLVCEFGSLHHMQDPSTAVREMCRVASKLVVISDINNFGSGRARRAKQVFNRLGMWKWVDLINTRGKGYRVSEGDGISYSYSVFNDLSLLNELCKSVHVFNIDGSARDPYRESSGVMLIGILTDKVAALGDVI